MLTSLIFIATHPYIIHAGSINVWLLSQSSKTTTKTLKVSINSLLDLIKRVCKHLPQRTYEKCSIFKPCRVIHTSHSLLGHELVQ